MVNRKLPSYSLLFLFVFTLSYYSWIYYWREDAYIQQFGGNLFSLLGMAITVCWTFTTVRQVAKNEKIFWGILLAANSSYLIAEIYWFYFESIRQTGVSYPGVSDIFYLIQVFTILVALLYKIVSQTKNQERIPFVFDTLIVMVVATTLSWHFILTPILKSDTVSLLSLIVSLAYPIGDLGILIAIVFILFSTSKQSNTSYLLILFFALFIQTVADSVYLYLISSNDYTSGSYIDPLFIIAGLLIGIAGRLTIHSDSTAEQSPESVKRLTIFQIVTPYGGALILFIFMGLHSEGIDIITIGSGISIILVFIRQITIIFENQRLFKKYYLKSQELEQSEERYKCLFENHPDPVYSTNLHGQFDSVNASCTQLLGYSQEELLQKSSLAFVAPSDRPFVSREVKQVFTGTARHYEVEIESRSGTRSFMHITNVPIIVQKQLVGVFGIGKDMTEIKEKEKRIHYLAYHDALTGLANRSSFEEMLEQTLRAPSTRRASLLFMDLNDFKDVNDTFGHDNGDQLLVSVAMRLQAFKERFTIIARLGGDEFTLLLVNRSLNDVEQLTKQVFSTLSEPYALANQLIHCPPSIGIASYPDQAGTGDELIKFADSAMYQAKTIRQGHYAFFDSTTSM
ncbi:diguanylate cyclase [Exiguobacterium sp. H66]|uniref:diguanylate cyclase domain-containing protein n=1 Tax=Exiguobacterium sp. H66 TaxID=2751208 RepID=UPI001BE6BED8|nr:diguanylate cyclase [Exiguobacterium sp. H66]